MTRPAGLILAGGEGSRLGRVRKAALKFAGRRLLDSAADALAPHCRPLLVSTGQHRLDALPDGAVALADRPGPPAGPIGGLLAAARWFRDRPDAPGLVVSLAVDTPLVPADFVPRLLAALPAEAPALAVAHAGTLYPTNAVWRRSALETLDRLAETGTAPDSPRALLARLGAPVLDWPEAPAGDPFRTVNTLSDLIRLSRRKDAPPASAPRRKSGLGKPEQTR